MGTACGGLARPAGDPQAIPDAAQVICDEGGTRLTTPIVRPRPDGVHLTVDNRTGDDLGISYRQGAGGAGDNADRGTTERVWPIAPGRAEVLCTGDDGIPEKGWASFEVADPEELWVSPELDCPAASGGVAVGSSGGSYAEAPRGDPRDPVEIAREFFAPLGEGDVVESAGYPAAEIRLVRLVRDGRTVAVADYADASFAGGESGSGWISEGYQACDGALE